MTARTRAALLTALTTAAFLLLAGPAAANSPWWHLTSGARPSILPVTAKAKGEIIVTATNLGDADADGGTTPVTIADTLPAGLTAKSITGIAGEIPGGAGNRGPVTCVKTPTLSCSFAGTLPPFDPIEIKIGVEVKAGVESGETNEADISGGDAPPAQLSRPLAFSGEPTPFGLEEYVLGYEEEGGAPATQAGSHPFQQTVTLAINQAPATITRGEYEAHAAALPKDVKVALPQGLIGNPSPFPRCSLAQFLAQPLDTGVGSAALDNQCQAQTAVGVALVLFDDPSTLHFRSRAVPVFNLEPTAGEPARFGLLLPGAPVLIDTALRSGNGEDYGVTASVSNISQVVDLLSSQVTFWGVPGDPRHDNSRGWGCLDVARGATETVEPCNPSSALHPPALLTLPTSCTGPLQSSAEIDSWAEPGQFLPPLPSTPIQALDGCNRLPFAPQIKAEPTADFATTGTGANFELNVDDEGLINHEGLAQSDIKKAIVALPEGMTADASLAEGLGVCSEAQYESETVNSDPGTGCPPESKIGSLEAESPLVTQKLTGALYIAKQEENPFHSLLALYMVIKNPELGILVRAAGHVEPDAKTGQLITTFDNLPQLPVSHFKLHLREGQRAPLITPPACGTYAVKADLFPWSEPSHGLERESSFKIDQGVGGGPCPTPGSLPFHPGFEAGTLNNAAGSYSPFSLRLTRGDGEQDMTKFSTVLPPGVVGKIAGVAKCPQSAIGVAKAKTGRQEQASPSCPGNSQIGRTLAGAGVGSTLVYVPGKLYLGGAYHGDPLSVIAIVPAVAGPFDVGNVVVQEALTLNPQTAEVEVDGSASDPLPHILAGIPLNVRDIRVYTDRPNFTLNPTSCERSSSRATLWGGGNDVFSSADDVPIGLTSPFQAADCASLGFAPKIGIELKGGTRRGAFPALKATATPRPGDANFSKAVVTLPHSAFLEQGHFGTICTRVQFAAGGGNGAGCPAASIYGHATATSPLIEEPFQGPVYLRSSNHNLPDLVVALHGIVNIDVTARIDSQKGGIRSSFESVPDAPVSKFTLEMEGGKKGLIVNSTDICAGKHLAKAALTGQNGKLDRIEPPVKSLGCGKGHKGAMHKHKGAKKKRHRGRHAAG